MSTLYSTSINLGSSATQDTGTSANNIVQLDSSAKLPAVDGSLLTNLPVTNVTGSLVYKGVYNATTSSPSLITAKKGDFYKVSIAGSLASVSLSVNDHIVFNQDSANPVTSVMFDVVDNSETTLATVATTGSYNDLSNTPSLGTSAVLDAGTSASNVIQLDSNAKIPAIDGSLLTNVTGTDASKLVITSNLSDLNNTTTARTNLGLGSSAVLDAGTSASNVIQLDSNAKIPAIDGSQLTNLPAGGASNLNGLSDVTIASIAEGDTLVYNSSTSVFENVEPHQKIVELSTSASSYT